MKSEHPLSTAALVSGLIVTVVGGIIVALIVGEGRFAPTTPTSPTLVLPTIVPPTAMPPIKIPPTPVPSTRVISTSAPLTAKTYDQVDDGELGSTDCSDWHTCRNATYANLLLSNLENGTVGVEFKSQRYFVKRIFLYFDTSPIPANALVKSANLNMYAGQFVNANNTIHVIRSIAGVPLSNDDFAKVQLVSGGSATPQHNSWMNINLNPVALDWIVKGGMTELALVHESDLNNSIPTETNDVEVALAENSQYRPYLIVVYSLP